MVGKITQMLQRLCARLGEAFIFLLRKLPFSERSLVIKRTLQTLCYFAGEWYRHQGHYGKAAGYFRLCLQQKIHTSCSDREIEAKTKLGLTHYLKGEYEEAELLYNQAIERLNECNLSGKTLSLLSSCYLGKAHISQYRGNFQEAIEFANISLHFAQKHSNPGDEAAVMFETGWIYYHQGNLVTAREYGEQAYKIYRRLRKHRRIVDTLNLLGASYYFVDPARALEQYLYPALKISQRHSYARGTAEVFTIAALAHFNLGQLQDAIDLGKKAVELYSKLGRKSRVANAKSNLAFIYLALNDQITAEELLIESLNTRKEIGSLLTGESYCYLADLYQRTGEIEKSLQAGKAGLDWYTRRKIGYQQGIVDILITLAATHVIMQERNAAFGELKEAVRIAKQIDYRWGLARAEFELGNAYQLLFNIRSIFQKSDDAYQEALTMAEGQFPEITWRTYLSLSRLYRKASLGVAKDKLQAAFSYLQQGIEVSESIRRRIGVEGLRISFQADKQDAYEEMVSLCLNLYRTNEGDTQHLVDAYH